MHDYMQAQPCHRRRCGHGILAHRVSRADSRVRFPCDDCGCNDYKYSRRTELRFWTDAARDCFTDKAFWLGRLKLLPVFIAWWVFVCAPSAILAVAAAFFGIELPTWAVFTINMGITWLMISKVSPAVARHVEYLINLRKDFVADLDLEENKK